MRRQFLQIISLFPNISFFFWWKNKEFCSGLTNFPAAAGHPRCQLSKEPSLRAPVLGSSTTLVPGPQPPALTPPAALVIATSAGHPPPVKVNENMRGSNQTSTPPLTEPGSHAAWSKRSSVQTLQELACLCSLGGLKANVQPVPSLWSYWMFDNVPELFALFAKANASARSPCEGLGFLLHPGHTSACSKHWEQSCLSWLKEGSQYQIKPHQARKPHLCVAEILSEQDAAILQKEI